MNSRLDDNLLDMTPQQTGNSSRTIEERIAQTHIKNLPVNLDASAVISNIFRVAVMFRNRAEQSVLGQYNLSFSGFTVLWVLWVWGEKQSKDLARESGIAKGTLTGIVQTLQKHGLVDTKVHEADSRRKSILLTEAGKTTIQDVFLKINDLESAFVKNLAVDEMQGLSQKLRIILNSMDQHHADQQQEQP